jgi:anti-sigma regulatory factor (Ser/Thr protein kinase)
MCSTVVEQRDLQHLLALEAAVQRSSVPLERNLDVSTYSLVALAELLTLRDRWSAAGHAVKLLGAIERPLLQSVRAVVASDNVRDSCLAACGCLKVPAAPDHAFADSQQRFLLGASAALKRAKFPTVARQRLLGAFGELIDNVFEHAGVRRWSIAAYEVDAEGRFTASVMDCGEGVLAGYLRNGMLTSESSATDALNLAVVEHRSSTGRSDRGLGFTQLMDALRSLDAFVRVRSDDASITLQGGATSSGVHPRLAEEFRLSGFVVSFRTWCNN